MWLSTSVYGPLCLYALLMTCGHAPDEMADGPRVSQLDSGLGNMKARQWLQYFRHPGTAFTLWPHKAGHYPAPGGTQGLLHQRRVWKWPWKLRFSTIAREGKCDSPRICLPRPSPAPLPSSHAEWCCNQHNVNFSRALAMLLLFLLTQSSRYCSCCGWSPSTALYSSSLVMVHLLVSPPCSWVCAEKANLHMDVPTKRSWTTCATWMGCRCSLMLAVVTRTLGKRKTGEESVRKDQHVQNVLGVVLLLALQCTYCHFHFASKQMKMINNCFCVVTGWIDIHGVWLTKCYTVLIRSKCSLN